MTAKELHDHVSQWPEVARDDMAYFRDEQWRLTDCDYHDDTVVPVEIALSLHVASGLEWLTDKLNGIRVFPSNDAGPGWYIDDNVMPPRLVARGPTLFHAIHKAILATKENA